MMDDTTLAVIRKTRTATALWSLSPIWPVPKHNGKQGLQGKRPVNGVHCFSRAFMHLSYRRPVPSLHVYGGVAGRRREEAVGAALNIQTRCKRAGKSYMFKLRDVRGAFTYVTHKWAMQHLEETLKAPEAVIHHNQHVNTTLRTPGGGDWKITNGTRQGDIPLKKYFSSRQPTNEVMKLEGQKIDVSLLTFVDDLMDILIEGTPGAMKLRDATKDRKLTQELEKVGCELEPSKEESLLKWMGPNARKNLAKCRSRGLLGPGRFPQAVRLLGCWLEVGGSGHNDQTKNYCNAHQLLQIRRFMEVKTCLFSNQKNSFPVSDQWSCTVRMRAICFFHNAVETVGV